MFSMPHGLTIDGDGHLWLTVRALPATRLRFVLVRWGGPRSYSRCASHAQDCGLHQVFKFSMAGQQLLARAPSPPNIRSHAHERERESGPGGLTQEVQRPLPSNHHATSQFQF